jgi:hypothetical protein
MSLADLVTHRTRLLLKESVGNATEEDLKQLSRLSGLVSGTESSITSEENNSSLEKDEKIIKDLEGKNTIKPKPDEPDDREDLDLDLDHRENLDFTVR